MFMRLLFGAHVSGPDEALGPLGGFALFALAIACWPSRRAAAPAPSAVLALLVFSLLCAVYLTYQGVYGAKTGSLLWAAAAGHGLVGALLVWRWLATKAIDRQRGEEQQRR